MSIQTPFFRAMAVLNDVGGGLAPPGTLALPGSTTLPSSSGIRSVQRYPGQAAGVYLFELESAAADDRLEGVATNRSLTPAFVSSAIYSVNYPAAGTYTGADGTLKDASYFRVVATAANATFSVEFKQFPQTL